MGMGNRGGKVRAHGAHGEVPTVPMHRISKLACLAPPSHSTIAGSCPQALPPPAMSAITARRASELGKERHPPPGSSPGILHQVIHQGAALTTTNEDGHELSSVVVGASAVGRLVNAMNVLAVDVDKRMVEMSDVGRALEPLSASCASSPPRPPSVSVPSPAVHPSPAPHLSAPVYLSLEVCVTADFAGSKKSVTHTHSIICFVAAPTKATGGVDVPFTKTEARKNVGTPTSAVCPHAPATRTVDEKLVGASGHNGNFTSEGQKTYTVARNHKTTMR